MKKCPCCKSRNVITFTADSDLCKTCGSDFPAVEDIPDGADRIAAERKRQIEKEGYTEEHDMQHSANDLARAGACYAIGSLIFAAENWPWDILWWKPSADPIRNLEKAGALIAAAIDRIQAEGK